MTTIGAKDLRLHMNDILDRVLDGEDIVVQHRFKAPVRLVPTTKVTSPNTGDKVARRLAHALEHLPANVPHTLRDPHKTYKQLQGELYRRDPKYRDYLPL
jgi:antitoxin (DNA-binding transcriptional repressor) of toxin-antitoxin stability system